MVEWSISDKTRNALFLLFGSIVYITAISAILAFLSKISPSVDVKIMFIFAILPLIAILLMVWGYGLRLKLPQAEIEYYPVEKIMKKPTVITDDKTGKDAENLMDKSGTDFINVVDKKGAFKGIFTRADAHRARVKGKIHNNIRRLMTRKKDVIYANHGEKLIDVLKKIGETKHSRLPILDKKDRVIGIVDAVDIGGFLSDSLKK